MIKLKFSIENFKIVVIMKLYSSDTASCRNRRNCIETDESCMDRFRAAGKLDYFGLQRVRHRISNGAL
jgi:hypothetical protein